MFTIRVLLTEVITCGCQKINLKVPQIATVRLRRYGDNRCVNRTTDKMVLNAAQPATMSDVFRFGDYDCIGFDLDNTLARFKVGPMIEMEYEIIANYLIKKKNYSKQFLLRPIDYNFIIKGLMLDAENGNLLKISDNGEIIQATHGTKFLSDSEILRYYPNRHWELTDLFVKNPLETWNSKKMRAVLDYFDIIVSLVFGRCIDWIDDREKGPQKSYNVWVDIFEALQYMFNREYFAEKQGEYFVEIQNNPEKYYYKCSQHLINWLSALKSSGKTLFLLTGSHVDFASHTAFHTLGPNWRSFFDIVVCFAKKPGFFTEKRPFYSVKDHLEGDTVAVEDLQLGEIYTQGNWQDLHKLLSKKINKDSPKFLYVGDNLLQDVYTPSVHSHCETVAVCEELHAEQKIDEEDPHPDEHFLVSNLWGSYFMYKSGSTNWHRIIKTHSKMCVPSMEYVASKPLDYPFQSLL